MSGSVALRSLYLDPSVAGVPWLLDPQAAEVRAGLTAAAERTAASSCDSRALIADLPDLLVLMRERHIGIATGVTSVDGLDAWAKAWRSRLEVEAPGTWGAAPGTDLDALRRVVGDNHLRAVGEDDDLIRTVDPREEEPFHSREVGPFVEERAYGDVLTIRLRQCGGRSAEAERLMTDFRDSHERHFAYDKIVVDLRSNPGGTDGFILADTGAHADGQLVLAADDVTLPTGRTPWRGCMVVLTDRCTASAGEGTAHLLRQAFGARLVGGRTQGTMTFGDITPYLLPRSRLVVWLATHWFGWSDVELVGLPVDVPIDPRTPLADVVARFDHLYGAASVDRWR